MSKGQIVVLEERRQRAKSIAPVLLEYQQPSTAVVEAPLPRSAQHIVWIIMSMLAALVGIAAVMPVDRVVSARGVLVSTSPTILVQPWEAGIVRSIDVHEGQEVRKGDLLARLDPTYATADVAALESGASSLAAQVARLEAEARGATFVRLGSDEDWALQSTILGLRKAQFESKLESYDKKLKELDAQIARSNVDAVAFKERLGVAVAVEDMRKTLEQKQVGTRLNTLIAQDNRAEMARALKDAEKKVTQADVARDALAAERDAFVRGWKADAAQQLSIAKEKAATAREQLHKAKLRRTLVELRADSDAVVQSIAKVSVGSVLQSGQQFFTLVPADAPLQVEAAIPGAESGLVHLADKVAIKFDTFAFTQYGYAEGELRIISPNSFGAQEEARYPTGASQARNGPEIFYRGIVGITRLALRNMPEGFRLKPGMPVTADIKIGKRTVLQYLFDFVAPVASEAMREP